MPQHPIARWRAKQRPPQTREMLVADMQRAGIVDRFTAGYLYQIEEGRRACSWTAAVALERHTGVDAREVMDANPEKRHA